MKGLIVIFFLACATHAQVASGGAFTLSQTAVAGGGGSSSNGSFTVEGTAGQHAAGGALQSGQFTIRSGFWTPAPLAPTAANVSIEGRILTAGGQGIRGVYVTLLGSDGVPRIALSSSFGYYTFTDVTVGDVYLLTVSTKRYVFPEPTRVVHVVDDLVDVDFVAAP